MAVWGSDFVSGAPGADRSYVYRTGLSQGVITVGAPYCAALGMAANNGSCIEAALNEAGTFDGAVGTVLIDPGAPVLWFCGVVVFFFFMSLG